jgi:hypothetical protein
MSAVTPLVEPTPVSGATVCVLEEFSIHAANAATTLY